MAESPRVLLVRFSAIGDCVMTAWNATSVRLLYPESHITWAVEKRCHAVIDEDLLVNESAVFDRSKGGVSAGKWWRQIRSYLQLRQQHFDWGIDFQGHGKTALALRIACPGKGLMVRSTDKFSMRLNRVAGPALCGEHTIEQNQRALANFGGFEVPDLPLMPKLPNAGKLRFDVVIAVGAGHPSKTWNLDRWLSAKAQLANYGLRVGLIGGPQDPLPDNPDEGNMVGKLTLRQSMEVIANSSCVLCGDTGAGHIAAAYGVSVVSIFGPTSPVLYRPYTQAGVVLQNGSEVNEVSVEEAVEAVLGCLRRAVQR